MEIAEKKYNKILTGRKRRVFKRKFIVFIKVFFLVIIFAGLIWGFNYFYNSSFFKISSIIFKNNISAEKLSSMAASFISSLTSRSKAL